MTYTNLNIRPGSQPAGYSKLAVGRNGAFRPRQVAIQTTKNLVSFWAVSRRTGNNPPIYLELDPDESRKLGQMLIDAGKEAVNHD